MSSKRADRYIQARFTGDRNGTWLAGMSKLTVAASSAYQLPAVFFEQTQSGAELGGC